MLVPPRYLPPPMTPEHIYEIAVTEFELVPRVRNDGWSYWTPDAGPIKSVRILRVSRTTGGSIAEIKLAATSHARQQEVFLSAPFTLERVRAAIANELASARQNQ